MIISPNLASLGCGDNVPGVNVAWLPHRNLVTIEDLYCQGF
jgi:hypothetical protein